MSSGLVHTSASGLFAAADRIEAHENDPERTWERQANLELAAQLRQQAAAAKAPSEQQDLVVEQQAQQVAALALDSRAESTDILHDLFRGDDILKIAHTAHGGNHFVAARDVKAGEHLILGLCPEVAAPLWPCSRAEHRASTTSELDAEQEWAILRRAPGPKPPADDVDDESEVRRSTSAYWLLALRVARRALHEPLYRQAVMALQCGPHAETDRAFLRGCGEMLSGGLSGALTADDCAQLLGAIHLNTLGTRATLGGAMEGVCLSTRASLFNHSCDPNVHFHTGSPETDGAMTFRAMRPIAAGEACTISYVDAAEPAYVRRRRLKLTKLFDCRCAVCVAPCEAGALQCDRCGGGWLSQAADAAPDGDGCWSCSRCGAHTAHTEVLAWDHELRKTLAELEELPPSEAGYAGLTERALSRCHPNHGFVLQARLTLLARCYPGTRQDVTSAAKKLGAAEAALSLALRILPPYDEQVGDLHYQIGSACNTLAAAHRSAGRAADAAGQWKRAAGALLESRRQFTFCSRAREAKAAGEFAAVCMRQLKSSPPCELKALPKP